MIPEFQSFAEFWGEYAMHHYGGDRELSMVRNLTAVLISSSIVQLIPARQLKTFWPAISLRYVALVIDVWAAYSLAGAIRFTVVMLTVFGISNLHFHFAEHTHRLQFYYSLKYEDAADKVKTMLKFPYVLLQDLHPCAGDYERIGSALGSERV